MKGRTEFSLRVRSDYFKACAVLGYLTDLLAGVEFTKANADPGSIYIGGSLGQREIQGVVDGDRRDELKSAVQWLNEWDHSCTIENMRFTHYAINNN